MITVPAHRVKQFGVEFYQAGLSIKDIDRLVKTDPGMALDWRLRVREQLQAAFAAGFVLDGFRPAQGDTDPALILTRKEAR